MTIWELDVHYFPHAVEAGVQPVEAVPYGLYCDQPGAYRSHTFRFDRPPSRADFLRICRDRLPWTSVWKDTLLKTIEAGECAWPMIDGMHVGGHADIMDDQGRRVGYLTVYREDVWYTEGYDRESITVTCAVQDAALRGLRGERRDAAEAELRSADNRIGERLAGRPAGTVDQATVVATIKAHLRERGLLGRSKAKRRVAAALPRSL